MRSFFAVGGLVIAALAFSGTARAQSGELWFDAGASLLWNNGLGSTDPVLGQPNDFTLGDGFRFGFRFGLNTREHIGYEIMYAYSRSTLNDKIDVPNTSTGMADHQVFFNGLYYLSKSDARIRPFATGGVGFINYVPPGQSAAYGGGNTKFGFNYGVGVKVKVGSKWGIRADLREYDTPKPFGLYFSSGWLHQVEASAGFGILF